MTDKEQLAYIAGLFDGEGCVSISKTWPKDRLNPRYKLCVTIANTNPKPLIIIKKLYGGYIYIGNKSPGRKILYTWKIATKSTERFLGDILPYLIIKKEEVELALIHRKFINKYQENKHDNKNKSVKCHTDEELKEQEKIKTQLQELKRVAYVM